MNRNFSQLERGARINPVNRRSRGLWWNWADTAMSVRCMDILQDGSVEEFEFETNGPVVSEYLLFMNDFPTVSRGFSFYETPTTPVLGEEPSFVENGLIFVGDHFALFGNVLYTTSQSAHVGPKGGIYGTTLTHKVETSGFPAMFYLLHRNLYQDAKMLNPRLQFDVVSNGGVIAGRYAFMDANIETMNIDTILPIFLRESAYTDEIADADNLYTESSGGITTVYAVCGIFAEKTIGP